MLLPPPPLDPQTFFTPEPALPAAPPVDLAPPLPTIIRNQARFVADVSVPDGAHLSAGEMFTKTWRVQNAGSAAWSADCLLFFAAGDRMNGPLLVPLNALMAPGQLLDISVPLTAPAEAGTYTGYWALADAAGQPFAKLYIQIVVVSSSGGISERADAAAAGEPLSEAYWVPTFSDCTRNLALVMFAPAP